MSWKSAARAVLPPVLTGFYQRLRAARGFRGRYASWAEAAKDSGGYSASNILESSLARAKAERDHPAAPGSGGDSDPALLLAAIFRQAALDGGRLHVLDFGGGLGTAYFRCRASLEKLSGLRWDVVEQPSHAHAGNKELADGRLRFHGSLAAYRAACPEGPNVLLLASVLPYLEKPLETLGELLALKPGTVFVDRTSVARDGATFLTVQVVPPEIYHASYPCWVHSRADLLRPFEANYRLEAEFPSGGGIDPAAEGLGFHFTRKA